MPTDSGFKQLGFTCNVTFSGQKDFSIQKKLESIFLQEVGILQATSVAERL